VKKKFTRNEKVEFFSFKFNQYFALKITELFEGKIAVRLFIFCIFQFNLFYLITYAPSHQDPLSFEQFPEAKYIKIQ
jgi:hypothetical protein